MLACKHLEPEQRETKMTWNDLLEMLRPAYDFWVTVPRGVRAVTALVAILLALKMWEWLTTDREESR